MRKPYPINQNKVASFHIANGQLHLQLSETLPWAMILAKVTQLSGNPNQQNKASSLFLELGKRFVPKYELATLVTLLRRNGHLITGIHSSNHQTKLAAASLTLNHDLTISEVCEEKILQPYFPGAQLPLAPENTGRPAVYIPHSVESGNRVYSKGQLVVAGNVDRGATVMAEGDILVWGKILGDAYAGMASRQDAIIRALSLKPENVAIGQFHLDTNKMLDEMGPSEIRIIDNDLLVVPLATIHPLS